MNNRKTNCLTGLVISIFFAFTVLFYGPLSQYLSNSQELWFHPGDVLRIIIPFSIAAIVLAAIVFLVLPPKAGSFLLKLFFGVSLAFYIQGNYIKNSYGTGVMDGTEIDWSAYTGYGIRNLFMWGVCIILPFIAARIVRNKKLRVTTILMIASLFLTVIQLPALLVQALSYQPNQNADLKISTEGIYELSAEDNVVMFILDTLDEAYYETYLDAHPDLKEELNGFVQYDNTLASGSRTTIGVPSMLTGSPYKKQAAYSEYIKDIYTQDNAILALHDSGYDVGVYSETVLFPPEASEYITNFSAGGDKVASGRILAKKLYKLDLFKFAPHFLKKYVWFDTAEFEEARGSADDYKLNDAAFYENFQKSGFTVGSSKKIFRLYHLYGAHEPYKLSADGKRVSDSTCEEQVVGTFAIVRAMIGGMKEAGLYDQAAIVITADHGDLNRAEHSMLLVKKSGETDAYRSTHVPASAFDLTLFLADAAGQELPEQAYGLPLDSLTEDMSRERHMFHNTTNDNKFIIDEYMTTEDAADHDKLTFVAEYQDAEDENTPYTLGTVLSFTTDATANKYCLEGIGSNTGFRSVLRGPHARMSIPIADPPKSGELTVHFTLHGKTAGGIHTVITANGTEVYDEETTADTIANGLAFQVPVSVLKDGNVLELEFSFPDLSEEEMKQKVRKRTETLSFTDMVIEGN